MRRQISLKLLLVVVSIAGAGTGLYVRTLQPEPIRYSTLDELIAEGGLEGMEIVRGLAEIEGARFENQSSSLGWIQHCNFSKNPGGNGGLTVREKSGAVYRLSERTDFVDIDHIHIAFLVRPEDKDVCHWLIFKGPTWDELERQDIDIYQWRQRNRNKRGRN